MANLLRRLIPDTCRRQLYHVASHNSKAIKAVLCSIDECSHIVIAEMKADRRHKNRA